jgi:hypothetical protein
MFTVGTTPHAEHSERGETHCIPTGYPQLEYQNHHTTPNVTAKKMAMPITIEKFTFVVRRCTSTSGNPELCFSIDMALKPWTRTQLAGAPLLADATASAAEISSDLFVDGYLERNTGGVRPT